MPNLIIYGSPNKHSFTMELLEKILLNDLSDYNFFDCFEAKPVPCDGCGYCKENEGCKFTDLNGFFEDFKKAKEVIFAFPVYNGSFPAPLKSLIDRFQFLYYDRFFKNRRPPIEGIREVTLVITAGSKIDPLPLITAQLSPLFTVCGCKLKRAIVLTGTDTVPTLLTKDF
ncbi:MAG: flavodoxin family protein [Clostridia bacterium]|nr:flavodoxin family protein [Clostridia bacterium]MBQ4131912.1 flavodoxin family protein [Clostridia bacterium]MBQ9920398.1 flavodoxin family protein [Clostridia bacterium]